jgi:hypothetical protein
VSVIFSSAAYDFSILIPGDLMPSAAIDHSIHDIDTVTGRYVLGEQAPQPGGNMLACRLRTISPTEFVATAPAVGAIGQVVSASFGPFGALQGRISRHVPDGFAVELDGARAVQAELARRIEAFSQARRASMADRRGVRRFMPAEPRSMLLLESGAALSCLIVEYSQAGAMISADTRPPVGSSVTVGHMRAQVVRHFDVGFAVRFDNPHRDDDIETLLETPRAWRKTMAAPSGSPVDTSEPGEPSHDGYGYD